MKQNSKKKENQVDPILSLSRRIYNPFRDRIRKHISDINDVITDEDLSSINIFHIVKQPANKNDLAVG